MTDMDDNTQSLLNLCHQLGKTQNRLDQIMIEMRNHVAPGTVLGRSDHRGRQLDSEHKVLYNRKEELIADIQAWHNGENLLIRKLGRQ